MFAFLVYMQIVMNVNTKTSILQGYICTDVYKKSYIFLFSFVENFEDFPSFFIFHIITLHCKCITNMFVWKWDSTFVCKNNYLFIIDWNR